MGQISLETLLIHIGDKLYTARHLKREKMTTVAKNIGVSHPVISLIENGHYKGLSLNLLCKLADYYKLTLAELILKNQK